MLGLNKIILIILILSALGLVFLFPQIGYAQELSQEQIDKHVKLPDSDNTSIFRSLPEVLTNEWMDAVVFVESAEKEAVTMILRQAIRGNLRDYYLREGPKELGIEIAKLSYQIGKVVMMSDMSAMLKQLEKLGLQQAMKYLGEWLLESETKISAGNLDFSYDTLQGRKTEHSFQYIIVYSPKTKKAMIKIYSQHAMAPPASQGSWGSMTGTGWNYTQAQTQGQKIAPFILTISGEMKREQIGYWGGEIRHNYNWTRNPNITLEFPSQVPYFQFQELGFFARIGGRIKGFFQSISDKMSGLFSGAALVDLPDLEPQVTRETVQKEGGLEALSALIKRILEYIEAMKEFFSEAELRVLQEQAEELAQEIKDEQDQDLEELFRQVEELRKQIEAMGRTLEALQKEQEKDGQIDQEVDKAVPIVPEHCPFGLVDLNTGSKEQLMSIVYIGEARAQEIIQWRITNVFQNIDDLLEIKGIGELTLEKIKEQGCAWVPDGDYDADIDDDTDIDDTDTDTTDTDTDTDDTATSPATGGGGGASAPSYPKILISEIQLSPIGQRFIELYNPNSSAVSLTGWYIQRKTKNADSWGSSVSSTHFDGKIIPAKGYLLIARTADINPDIILDILTLTEDNAIVLKNPNKQEVDKVGWGQAPDFETAPTENPLIEKSIGRKWNTDNQTYQDTNNNANDFEMQVSTPGARNQSYMPEVDEGTGTDDDENDEDGDVDNDEDEEEDNNNDDDTDNEDEEDEDEDEDEEDEEDEEEKKQPEEPLLTAVINEIAWMGTEANWRHQWLELYNPGEEIIEMAGWRLFVPTTETFDIIFEQGTAIQPNGFYVLARGDEDMETLVDVQIDARYGNFGTDWNLNNAGEIIELYNNEGVLIDRVDASQAWFAGDNNTKQTMERIDSAIGGTDSDNWASNNGIGRNGLDIEGNSINGTPGAENSVSKTVVSQDTALPAGEYVFQDLVVKNGATLTLEADEDIEGFKGVKITADNIIIEQSSLMTAVGQGYSQMVSVGKNYSFPDSLGSAGRGREIIPGLCLAAPGGPGGGAIILEIENDLAINGTISTNGLQGVGHLSYGCPATAGGDGGSIYIKTKTLKGNGEISSSGADSIDGGGAGNGGQAAVYYQDDQFQGEIYAYGGSNRTSGGCGSPGTVYFENLGKSKLIIENSCQTGVLELSENLNGIDVLEISNCSLSAEKEIMIQAGEIILNFVLWQNIPKEFLIFRANDLIVENSEIKANIRAEVNDFSLRAGSFLSVSGLGHGSGEGPGTGERIIGGSYGGQGGRNATSSVYGSPENPQDFGSGGGKIPADPGFCSEQSGGAGGGAIIILAENILALDGEISADGEPGIPSPSWGCSATAAGSGGSVYLETGFLEGTGKISANGGNAFTYAGAGGGGRIAIHGDTSGFFGEIEAKGGVNVNNGNYSGQEGTIYPLP
jgi:DNA uptake protein ComE-like DNA-binding protein